MLINFILLCLYPALLPNGDLKKLTSFFLLPLYAITMTKEIPAQYGLEHRVAKHPEVEEEEIKLWKS